MHGAGVLEHAPFIRAQARAVSQHQRRQRAAATLGIRREQTLAPGVAPGIQAAGRTQPLARLHRADGADPLRQ
nr:hypothetical protein [Pseudomonas aeruginosa]